KNMVAILTEQARDSGEPPPFDPGPTQAQIQAAQAPMPDARGAKDDATAAAATAQARDYTELVVTLDGTNNGEECQLTLHATLEGRQARAQIVHGAVDNDLYAEGEPVPEFRVQSYPPRMLKAMRSFGSPDQTFGSAMQAIRKTMGALQN